MSADGATALLVRRVFPHSRARVFAAFASGEVMQQWFAPGPEIRTHVESYDFREGGGYLFSFTLPDASTIRLSGTFEQIDPPASLAYTWCWAKPDPHAGIESQVSIEFSEVATGTELVIQHRRLDAPEMVPRHTGGWHDTLGQLDLWLASSSPS